MLSLGHLLKLWWGQCVVAAAAVSAALLYYVTVDHFFKLEINAQSKGILLIILGSEHKSIICFLKVSSDNSDQEELIPINKAIYEIEIILLSIYVFSVHYK